MKIHRRQFLSSTFIGSFFCTILGIDKLVAAKSSDIDVLSTPGLLGILNNEEHISDIGRSYRVRKPSESTIEQLLGEIENSIGDDIAVSAKQLRKVIASDFESGKTVQVEGWILSITEARQCALFSILHS